MGGNENDGVVGSASTESARSGIGDTERRATVGCTRTNPVLASGCLPGELGVPLSSREVVVVGGEELPMDGRVFGGGSLEGGDLDNGVITPVITSLNQSDVVSRDGKASGEWSSTGSGTNDDIVVGVSVCLCFCLSADNNRPERSVNG